LRDSRSRVPSSVDVKCGAKIGIFVVKTRLVTCRCGACRADNIGKFTPSDFERHSGRENSKKWKVSITVPSMKKTLGAWLAGYGITANKHTTTTPSDPIRAIRPSAPSAFRATHPPPAPPLPAPIVDAIPAVPADTDTFSTRLDAALQSGKMPEITGWRVADSNEISVSLNIGSVSFSGTLKESPKLMTGAMEFERRGYIPIPTERITFMTGMDDATMIIPPDFFRTNILAWPMYCLGKHAVWMQMYMKYIVNQRNLM
jgi:hypothetical protein